MSKRDWRRAQQPSRRELIAKNFEFLADTPVLCGPGCWCGEPLGHDWPDKEEGAPHPR